MPKRPVIRSVECLVPGCDRHWMLEGKRQGFVKAAAKSHCMTHFQRYHEAQKHPPNGSMDEWHGYCKLCHPKGGIVVMRITTYSS